MARVHRITIQKRSSCPRKSRWCDHSPRARHPGMQSQVGLRKHHYHTIALISHTSQVMLKILHARLQQFTHNELPDVPAGFRRGRGARDKLPTSIGSLKKQKISRKKIHFCFIDYAKAFDWVDQNCEKFLKRWE